MRSAIAGLEGGRERLLKLFVLWLGNGSEWRDPRPFCVIRTKRSPNRRGRKRDAETRGRRGRRKSRRGRVLMEWINTLPSRVYLANAAL